MSLWCKRIGTFPREMNHVGQLALSGVDYMRLGAVVTIPAIFGAVIWGAKGALFGGAIGVGLIALELYALELYLGTQVNQA